MEEGEAGKETAPPVSTPVTNVPTTPINTRHQQTAAKARGRTIEQVLNICREMILSTHRSNLQELVKGKLDAASKTGKLDMSGMGLPIIPADIFAMPNLKVLSLADNQIRQVPPDIAVLSALTQLRLSGNMITKLPAEIGLLTNLQTLWIQNNKLTQLPTEIETLTSLTALSMSGNMLQTLPMQLLNLTGLKELHTESAMLKSPPPSIAAKGTKAVMDYLKLINKAHSVGFLDLSSIGLEHFPPDVGCISTLTKLRLTDNSISLLSDDIKEMRSLTDLDVSNNKISEITAAISNLTSLTILNLEKNQLQELPCEICFCSRLLELNTFANPLTAPPKKVLSKGLFLKPISDFYISHNLLF
jgi:Leucine-rich repeat (LRR) protein